MGTMGSFRLFLFQSFSPLIHSIDFCVCAYYIWERLQACLNRKVTSPGLENPMVMCMARGVYFALQAMSKFFLLFLCCCYYNAKLEIFGWIPEVQDFLKQFCSSNHLFLFSFLSPSTLLMHMHIFRPSPRFILREHSLKTLFHTANPLLTCVKGLLAYWFMNCTKLLLA